MARLLVASFSSLGALVVPSERGVALASASSAAPCRVFISSASCKGRPRSCCKTTCASADEQALSSIHHAKSKHAISEAIERLRGSEADEIDLRYKLASLCEAYSARETSISQECWQLWEGFCNALKDNKRLQTLHLQGNDMGHATNMSAAGHVSPFIASLAMALAGSESLRFLNLSANGLSADDVAAISDALCGARTMRALHLYANEIGDDGAVAIAKSMATGLRLEVLELSFNSISDRGAVAIARALEQQQIEQSSAPFFLHLRHNNVGPAGRAALARVYPLRLAIPSAEFATEEIRITETSGNEPAIPDREESEGKEVSGSPRLEYADADAAVAGQNMSRTRSAVFVDGNPGVGLWTEACIGGSIPSVSIESSASTGGASVAISEEVTTETGSASLSDAKLSPYLLSGESVETDFPEDSRMDENKKSLTASERAGLHHEVLLEGASTGDPAMHSLSVLVEPPASIKDSRLAEPPALTLAVHGEEKFCAPSSSGEQESSTSEPAVEKADVGALCTEAVDTSQSQPSQLLSEPRRPLPSFSQASSDGESTTSFPSQSPPLSMSLMPPFADSAQSRVPSIEQDSELNGALPATPSTAETPYSAATVRAPPGSLTVSQTPQPAFPATLRESEGGLTFHMAVALSRKLQTTKREEEASPSQLGPTRDISSPSLGSNPSSSGELKEALLPLRASEERQGREVQSGQPKLSQSGWNRYIEKGPADLGTLLPSDWRDAIAAHGGLEALPHLNAMLEGAWKRGVEVYPRYEDIFRAFELCPYEKMRVVIIGQDPYPRQGAANGLAFSSHQWARRGTHAQSLTNIFLELERNMKASSIHWEMPKSGDLSKWAEQGVLLLNASLTIASRPPTSEGGKQAGDEAEQSHKEAWRPFTQAAVQAACLRPGPPIVFLLWGKDAQKLQPLIREWGPQHEILTAGHPSPLSVKKFEGCSHFNKVNDFFTSRGLPLVSWRL